VVILEESVRITLGSAAGRLSYLQHLRPHLGGIRSRPVSLPALLFVSNQNPHSQGMKASWGRSKFLSLSASVSSPGHGCPALQMFPLSRRLTHHGWRLDRLFRFYLAAARMFGFYLTPSLPLYLEDFALAILFLECPSVSGVP
jgi:hypothetical protein